MKPEQLAKRLNITSGAIRKWTGTDFRAFFSPSAIGGPGARRSFSEQDARILAWIVQLKAQNMPADEITGILRNAQRSDWRELPPMPTAAEDEVAMIPREAVEERIKALQEQTHLQIAALEKERDDIRAQLERERSQLQARLDKAENENVQLRQRLDVITDRLLTLLEKDRRHD